MKLQLIAALAALASAGAANAALNDYNSGNSSVAFIAYDATGTSRSSVFVDLGFSMNDFVTGDLGTGGQEVVWNFANNSVTVNGQAVAATNDFSAFASFFGAAQSTEVRWAVIGGSTLQDNQSVLLTGTPTASQLSQQDAGFSSSAAFVGQQTYAGINALLAGAADNESYYAPNANDPGYTATGQMFGLGNYVTNTKWNGGTNGARNNFWLADALTGEEQRLADLGVEDPRLLNNAGTFVLDRTAQTLTWVTAPIPEPSTYAMVIAGLAVTGLVARRRAAK